VKRSPSLRDPGPADWRSQLRSAIRTADGLRRYVRLSRQEEEGIRLAGAAGLRWGVTPYYASLMDPADPSCPVRRQAIPSAEEMEADGAGSADPMGEEAASPVPGLIRLYPDRVAWCVTDACPVYCRHCFRRRFTAQAGQLPARAGKDRLERALRYIGRNREIRDVLVTGGDPLMLPDAAIDRILRRLRAIPHVEIVRIGTRAPVTLPQRITKGLCAMLRRHHPLWINTQFNHPREVAPLAARACALLADAGIPLGNQSVLLRGVNDGPGVLAELGKALVRIRVRPYYLFQCHLAAGTAHFRTPVESGLEAVASMRGTTTGFAVPVFVVDTPYGKVPLHPGTVVDRDAGAVYLRSYDGRIWREPNPAPERRGGASRMPAGQWSEPSTRGRRKASARRGSRPRDRQK
jgi:lysine 2,3-aminomutase